MTVSKRIHRLRTRLQFKCWSVQNWCKGFKFGPVQRFRCCDHTTPVHSRSCPNA